MKEIKPLQTKQNYKETRNWDKKQDLGLWLDVKVCFSFVETPSSPS